LLTVLAAGAEEVVAAAGFELTEVLIVDDGSSDGTAEILRTAEAEQPRIKAMLGSGHNRGKGAAVATGVAAAQGDFVLLVDVDLSTPLEELPKLAAARRDGADVAIGSRAIEGAVVERGPAHRKLMGKSFNGTVRLLTGLDVHDTQCGFKLLPTVAAKDLLAAQACPGFAFDVELLMRAEAAGLTIVEVPVLYLHDERSRVRVVSASIEMLKDVCGLAYRLRFREGGRSRRSAAGRQRASAGLPADDSD
jgi:dolichyl-phosphate beta-glucosyltransferase